MYLSKPAIELAAAACGDAGNEIGALYARRDIADEDDFTSALIQRIRSRLERLQLGGVEWRGRKTSSRYPNSDENRSGADLLGVLEVELPEIRFRKGFLAQAKRDRVVAGWDSSGTSASRCSQSLPTRSCSLTARGVSA
jgi:hypothetical protein